MQSDLVATKEEEFIFSPEQALSVIDDVEDDSVLEPSSDVTFSITSYGADYTVDTLIARLKRGDFYVPTFQRKFVWSQRHASRFVESLLLGLPVPGIFLYKESVTNKHLVVDGQQRLRTLQYFYSGVFLEKKFRLIGVRKEWDGKTYSELPPPDQLKLDDSIVHATIFQQDEPQDSQKSLYFVFERINSGGIRLSPQEIRNCINDGPLLNLVRSLNETPAWRNIFGEKHNNRLKDQELILRFLAMAARSGQYTRPMKEFLNAFTSDFQALNPINMREFSEAFIKTITLIGDAKGKSSFRPSRALNAAVFEAVMLGLSVRISMSPTLPTADAVARAYDKLIADRTFMRACERATADEESVKTRQSLAVAAFLVI